MNPREYELMFAIEDRYWWYRGMRAIARRFAPDVFAARRILDAGCGTGANLVRLGPSGLGLDRSFEALVLCRRRGLRRLVAGSVESLPFRDAAFSAVTSYDVLYTVPDDLRALREISRVCERGGRVLLSVPAFAALGGEHDRAVHGLRRYTKSDLGEKVRTAGLATVRATYANFFLAPAIYAVRLARRVVAPARRDEDATSDFGFAPPAVEAALHGLLALEARLVARVRLPFGVTLFLLAERPR